MRIPFAPGHAQVRNRPALLVQNDSLRPQAADLRPARRIGQRSYLVCPSEVVERFAVSRPSQIPRGFAGYDRRPAPVGLPPQTRIESVRAEISILLPKSPATRSGSPAPHPMREAPGLLARSSALIEAIVYQVMMSEKVVRPYRRRTIPYGLLEIIGGERVNAISQGASSH